MTGTITIGILNDSADRGGPMGLDDGGPGDLAGWIEREARSLIEAGRLCGSVAIVHAYALGLPGGTADALEAAYRRLAETPVDLVIGPFVGDNARVAAPLAEALRLPTLICTDEDRARGRHVFQLQTGNPAQEAALIAGHLRTLECRAPLVVHDATPFGERLARQFAGQGALHGFAPSAIAALDERPEPAALDTVVAAATAPHSAPSCDALVYLGQGHPARALAARLRSAGFTGPCLTNCASAAAITLDAAACEGWFHVATVSVRNPVLARALETHAAALQDAPSIALGHDVARLVGEAMARAVGPGRSGLRLGLEQVTWLDAAHGDPGTKLGFGVYERAALHGPYLVMRQWRGAQSVDVG
ncbi:ABC transporter substrate-binding protein [Novosphingobium sp. 1949]|uniref:ABC transporter substrate-binding protein n=1 Tax=Novosphingobium organovorum TaxID=2930092 RepID=A0ABT0B9H7_9SPHN|nr:ABC transporter substrate-binding protein [Novosphingobium organovorum]MCJ2181678.1 ABC transporter substrate-binding protein [Novosphingobium organovorum]